MVVATFRQQPIKKLLPLLLLIFISIPGLVLGLDTYPPIWFDEGYKLNAARTLTYRSIYGTYTTAGYVAFDPGISSGPADVLPTALVFKLVGVGVAEARIVSVFFTLLAVCCLYSISSFLYERRAALFITMFSLASPAIQGINFLMIGRQILGEPAALALTALGLWLWFRSWESKAWFTALLAGLTLGLGLLSKSQVGIALLPSLTLIAIGRGLRERSHLPLMATPIIVSMSVLLGWMLIGRLGTSAAIRTENSAMLLDAIRSNLLTGLYGRTLSKSAFIIVLIMGLGTVASVKSWRVFVPSGKVATNSEWAEATVSLFVLFSALWFTFLSVGWPRYAYAGLVFSLLLIGKLVWNTLKSILHLVGASLPRLERIAYEVTIAGLALIVIVVNIYPILQSKQDYQAQQMADYISSEVEKDAIVESWEWELDALSSHWEYHHPHQRYLFLAIRQFSHERKPFNLNYDVLESKPDYLVTGPFSNWTGIYETDDIKDNFIKLEEIGAYTIYQFAR
jgi:4-amino-4-deoxy-L-arabinose transferase-like glycosyltransferase